MVPLGFGPLAKLAGRGFAGVPLRVAGGAGGERSSRGERDLETTEVAAALTQIAAVEALPEEED